MRLWPALALLALAACEPPVYVEPWPEPMEPLPEAPETVLRIPPDFRFTDYETGRQYFLRRYTVWAEDAPEKLDLLGGEASSLTVVAEGDDLRLEVVTVLEPDTRQERLASWNEREFAFDVLQREWLGRGRAEMLTYYLEAHQRERRMSADLLDARIRFKEAAVRQLNEERLALYADLLSIRQTKDYRPPAGRAEWLDFELKKRDLELIRETADLELLRYHRQLRNTELGRSSGDLSVRELLPVAEIVDGGLSPDELVARVKEEVRPDSWSGPSAVIRYAGGFLEVVNTREAVGEVREYLDDLRAEFAK